MDYLTTSAFKLRSIVNTLWKNTCKSYNKHKNIEGADEKRETMVLKSIFQTDGQTDRQTDLAFFCDLKTINKHFVAFFMFLFLLLQKIRVQQMMFLLLCFCIHFQRSFEQCDMFLCRFIVRFYTI